MGELNVTDEYGNELGGEYGMDVHILASYNIVRDGMYYQIRIQENYLDKPLFLNVKLGRRGELLQVKGERR